MPLQGLSFMLENVQTVLLGQNVLTTLKITGGDSFGNVSLRFNMEDSGLGMENTQVTYRKTSHSQVAKDSNRFTEWQAKMTESDGTEMVPSVIISQVDSTKVSEDMI